VCGAARRDEQVAPPDDLMLGRTIDGRYVLRRHLGRGGMGAVYAADHVGLHRTVAIKFLTHRGDPVQAERFRREARAASQISHEHVVQVFDVGTTDDGIDYIVMEYVDGTDLQQVLAGGALDPARAVSIARQMALGLHAIHSAGIIHRDVKPANVLLAATRDGHDFVKLTDFSIAKSVRESEPLTATGVAVGTPQFMAPEQFLGESLDQADLYAVGVTLYLMLTGCVPFGAKTPARLARMHVNDAPIRIEAIRPGLPRALVDLVGRALEKAPQARFETALDLAAALDAIDATTVAGANLPGAAAPAARIPPTTIDVHVPGPRRPPQHANRFRATPDSLDFSRVQKVGRFELIRELARGGMGQVFLARDTKLGRKVAIKFLLHDNPSFVQRFLTEARATALCTHENIVTIYEVGEHEGLPYMVLELLEGRPLSEVLATGTQPEVLELFVPVLRALARAHEFGIVHRDLKPSNVFVTDTGQVKVLDFGVARLLDREEHAIRRVTAMMAAVDPPATQDDAVVGTVTYMSPEQWGAAPVDHRSDLFAVGVMLWRILVRGHPAQSTTPEALAAELCDLDQPFPSIAARDPALPRQLVTLVDRCLAKRASARYQTANEVLGDLEAYLAPGERGSTSPADGVHAGAPVVEATPGEVVRAGDRRDSLGAVARTQHAPRRRIALRLGVVALAAAAVAALSFALAADPTEPAPDTRPMTSRPAPAPHTEAAPGSAASAATGIAPSRGANVDAPHTEPAPGSAASAASGMAPSRGADVDAGQGAPEGSARPPTKQRKPSDRPRELPFIKPEDLPFVESKP
jgi:serine/threonine protein kinase